MRSWIDRTTEERGLLSPNFCSIILWSATSGYSAVASNRMMALELSFVILPIVLHRNIRDSLPRSSATSFAVWLNQDPLTRAKIADRAQILVDYTREGLRFAGLHGLLKFSDGHVQADSEWKSKVTRTLRDCSEEVQTCVKRAEFVGKWLYGAGSPATVLALIGVRP